METKRLVWTAMLTALAVVIPLVFSSIGLVLVLGPFTATVASHVPVMLAMFLTPGSAFLVGLGSALSFMAIHGMVVAARAAMHAFVAAGGAVLIGRGRSFAQVLLITLPIHGLLESLIVLPFGYSLYQALVVVGLGTAIHHAVDMVIALSIVKFISPILPRQI